MPNKVPWNKYICSAVNDRQFALWRRSMKMYSNLKYYRIVSTNYSALYWLSFCKLERHLVPACYTLIRLLSGSTCLRMNKKHTCVDKICQLCMSGQKEDLYHFAMCCEYFSDIRAKMFSRIDNCVNNDTRATLRTLPREIYFYILIGMDYPLDKGDIFKIRKISVNVIHKMYSARQKIED